MKRRALLITFPFVILAACARVQPVGSQAGVASDLTGMAGQNLRDLTGGVGQIVWLSLTGYVRLIAGNTDVRPATLQRAIMMGADGSSARIFDVWQIVGSAPLAGPSTSVAFGRSGTKSSQTSNETFNEDGATGLWLNRNFTHAAFNNPIESSRLSRLGARVLAIDATQIWLVEGGVGTAPALVDENLAAFEAWRSA